jgi:hypothetical protein
MKRPEHTIFLPIPLMYSKAVKDGITVRQFTWWPEGSPTFRTFCLTTDKHGWELSWRVDQVRQR